MQEIADRVGAQEGRKTPGQILLNYSTRAWALHLKRPEQRVTGVTPRAPALAAQGLPRSALLGQSQAGACANRTDPPLGWQPMRRLDIILVRLKCFVLCSCRAGDTTSCVSQFPAPGARCFPAVEPATPVLSQQCSRVMGACCYFAAHTSDAPFFWEEGAGTAAGGRSLRSWLATSQSCLQEPQVAGAWGRGLLSGTSGFISANCAQP